MTSRSEKKTRKSASKAYDARGLDRAPDFGPAEQARRVRVRVAADPDRPNASIVRAEVISVPHRLWELGWLSDEEREAADRIAQAYETVQRVGSCLSSLVRASGSGGQVHVTEAAVRASGWLREVYSALGPVKGAWTIEVCALNRWPVPPAEAQRAARSAAKLQRQLRIMARRWKMI